MAKRVLKPIVLVGSMGLNPFSEGLVIDVVKMVHSGSYEPIVDEDSGDTMLLPSESTVEYGNSVKVYTEMVNRGLISKLGHSSAKLYLWVLYKVKPGEDWIWINRDVYMEENDVRSKTTYREGVTGLIKAGILGYTSMRKEVYWINPRLFFCGSRIKKFKDKVRLKS